MVKDLLYENKFSKNSEPTIVPESKEYDKFIVTFNMKENPELLSIHGVIN